MALSINGTGHANTASATTLAVTLNTATTGDLVVVVVEINAGPVTSVSSTHLTFSKRASASTASPSFIEEWTAIAGSSFASEVITVNFTSAGFATINVFGVSGVNIGSPFDGTAVTTTGASPPVISTTSSSSMVVGLFRLSAAASSAPGAGFGLTQASADFLTTEFSTFSSPQTSLTVTQGAVCNGAIADAFRAAGGSAAVTFNIHTNLNGWSPLTYAVGNRITSGGNAYKCIFPGSSTAAPTGTGSAINNGGVAVFKWLSAADFTTIAAASAALPSVFSQPIIWAFWNNGTILTTGTSPFATLTGHTTTSTNNLTWTCAPGESIRDSLSGGHIALAFNAAAGVSFTLPVTNPGFHVDYFDIFDANVVFDGLQFQNPNATNGCSILAIESAATNFIARNCIFDFTAQTGMTQLGFYGPNFIVSNSLVVDHQSASGGQIPIKTQGSGHFINDTFIAPNSPAGTLAIIADNSPAGDIIVRNCASFGYPAGIANSVVTTGSVALDHCATDATSIGVNNTDAGSNLLSRSVATSLVALASDVRLVLGSSLSNAGATDTTDIPAADDIARTTRPQGVSWDIGAFELIPVILRGASRAMGRAQPFPSSLARGASRAQGRSQLSGAGGPQLARGVSGASGRAVGNYTQAAISYPWSVDFGGGVATTGPFAADFREDFPIASGSPPADPFGPLTSTNYTLAGQTRTFGRAIISGQIPLSASGIAKGSGRLQVALRANLADRGTTRSAARAQGLYALTVGAVIALAKASGRATIATGLNAITAAGTSRSRGANTPLRFAFLVAAGKASARGAATSPPVSAVLKALGKTQAAGLVQGLYVTLSSAATRGFAAGMGRSGIGTSAALSAVGRSASTGAALYGDGNLIISGAGRSVAAGSLATPTQTTALSAASRSIDRGSGALNIAQPIVASGAARARSQATVLYAAQITSRGKSSSHGALTTTAGLLAGVAGRGSNQGRGKALFNLRSALLVRSASVTSGRAGVFVAMPLHALGLAQISGQLGPVARLHLVGAGLSAATGRGARPTAAVAITGVAKGVSKGLTSARFFLAIGATGAGSMAGTATASMLANLQAAAKGISTALATTLPAAQMAATSTAMAYGTTASQFLTLLAASGQATTAANSQAITGVVALTGRGLTASAGRVVGLGFAPVSLSAIGRSGGSATARPTSSLSLPGTTIGFSAGRCAAINTAVLAAAGRSRSAGQMAAAGSVGFLARGRGDAAGRLFSRLSLPGFGRASSSGHSNIAGMYNVIPDNPNAPKLSSISSHPAFDAMDIGDVDFFSFDWSARVSVIGDPIVSASVTITPSGMSAGPVIVVGNIVQVRCASTSLVETYSLRCTVVLRSGRILHDSAPVSVADF